MIRLHTINGFIFSLLFFVTACEQGELPQPHISEEKIDIGITGEIREPEQSTFSPFSVSLGWFNESEGFVFWQGDISEGELGTTLIMGAYGDLSLRPMFGFQFWSADLPSDRDWTKEEVEILFAPGTSFPFGEGPGKVDFSLRLPIGGPFAELEPSKSSFLAAPEGTLIVIDTEDYNFTDHSGIPVINVKGKLIRCTIEGQVGRYDKFDDQADGMPWFETNEVVEIANGEVVFYVEYLEQ